MRPKPDHDVAGERFRELEEVALVHDFQDQLLDVVGLVGIFGHQRVERGLFTLGLIERRPLRNAGGKIRRQKIDQPAHLQQTFDVVVVGAVGDGRFGGVHGGAAELFGGDDLVGHRLHHVGPGDEHVAGVAHHEDEIGHCRRIDIAAGTGAHDHRNLRNDAGGDHIALEHLAVTAERGDAFLDAGAAGIEQADDRRAGAHRHVLDLDDLLRVRLRQRAAEHGEILGEGEDGAAVHGAEAGDDAVAGDLRFLHAEIVGAMLDEHVELLERVAVHQQLDALARGELAALVLRLDALFAAAAARAGATCFELVENVFHIRLARSAAPGRPDLLCKFHSKACAQRHERRKRAPLPLVGRGWGWGSGGLVPPSTGAHRLPTPTLPSPQGGGFSFPRRRMPLSPRRRCRRSRYSGRDGR